MLETTLVALQDITLEKIFDDNGRKILFTEFPQIMQQVWYWSPAKEIKTSDKEIEISYTTILLNAEKTTHSFAVCLTIIVTN